MIGHSRASVNKNFGYFKVAKRHNTGDNNPMITINDVANLAGVSKSTVSRVMTNPSLVKAETRERVQRVIRRKHYVPSTIAQNLSGTPTKTVGIVINEMANFFFVEILEGVDRVLSANGYSLEIYSSQWIAEKESAQIRALISKRADGVLLAPLSSSSKSITMLLKAKIPLVVFNCIPDSRRCPYVVSDNFAGGTLVGEYMNTLGARQHIVVSGFEHQTITDRVNGCLAALKAKRVVRYENVSTFKDGESLVPILIKENRIDSIKTALFITNDNVAIGALHKLIENRIRIPEQVSVIGYDDIKLAKLCKVALTTVSQNAFRLGSTAAEKLLDIISQKAVRTDTVFAPSMIVRESSK